MTPSAKIPWKRIGAEAVAIVVSILLAFGIEAWWQERGDIEQEARILMALQAEFERNDVLLKEANDLYRDFYGQAIRILDYLDLPSGALSDAELEMLMAGLLRGNTIYLESGAHDALLSSGELSLVRDTELQNMLAAWPSHVAEWSEEQDAVFMYVRNNMQPYFFDVLPARGLGQHFRPFPNGESPAPVLPSAFDAAAMRDVFALVSFENLMYQRAQGLWYAIRDGETLRARIRAIQTSLEKNLVNN